MSTPKEVVGHTPTPWAVHPHFGMDIVRFADVEKSLGSSVDETEDRERYAAVIAIANYNDLSTFAHRMTRKLEAQANAAFIVTACNSFDSHVEQIKALREALQKAKELISQWHSMGMSAQSAKTAWAIYERNAPEMKPINEALAEAEKQ